VNDCLRQCADYCAAWFLGDAARCHECPAAGSREDCAGTAS
jgi:hypothetical protein